MPIRALFLVSHGYMYFLLDHSSTAVQSLYNSMLVINHVISEMYYKWTILQSNYRKRTIIFPIFPL